MKWSAVTNHEPMTLQVFIETKHTEKIWLEVCDFYNHSRKFTERYMSITGKKTLEVMMPQTPEKCLITVFNERTGKTKTDKSFMVLGIKRIPLKQRLSMIGLQNPKIKSFIRFAQNFCYYLPEMAAKGGSFSGLYKSDDGKFYIELLPTIIGSNGQELNTPARINKDTGVIQVSKKAFFILTIPEMMAILLHEFSHFNISTDIDDESEADLNGLLIYLSLGYPRIEASEAWGGVFEKAATTENKERYELIHKFINDFDNKKI